MEIELRNANKSVVTVAGWTERHDACPRLKEQVTFAKESADFELLFRGQSRRPEYLGQLFLVGQKSKLSLYAGNCDRLDYDPKNASENRDLFVKVLKAYDESEMGKHFFKGDIENVIEKYDQSSDIEKFDLTQLLLAALQYQNCKEQLKFFRDRMYLLSATKLDELALMYALTPEPYRKGTLLDESFVFEYAPPNDPNHFEMVNDLSQKLQKAGLGKMYHNKEEEAFVKFAMLPHYLLGYGHLKTTGENAYVCEYVPNPRFADGSATLDNPPDLNAEQEELLKGSRHAMAWVELFGDDGWTTLYFRQNKQDAERNISKPRS